MKTLLDRQLCITVTYLQELLQKRDAICPLVHIIEGIQASFHLLRVLLVLGIRCESLLRDSCSPSCLLQA